MNIHLRTTYRGRMRDMKRILVVKAMVLGAIACSISAIGFAANIQDGNSMDSVQQTVVTDEAKHKAIRSNWMDRTEIKVGTQAKSGMQVSVDTLQPLTHYDENSKSVLFVQGGIASRGGEAHEFRYYHAGNGGVWYPLNPLTGKGERTDVPIQFRKTERLGNVANVGIGYRHLSKNEHAYVGLNAFVDRAFSENANRVSGGLEYVSGLNEVHANVYKGLGGIKSEHYKVDLRHIDYFPFPLHGGTASYDVYKPSRVLSGYDVSYARTFKNARWARVYVDVYHWSGIKVAPYGSEGPLKVFEAGKSNGVQVGTTLQVTPHVSLDLGYTSDSKYASGAYGFIKYTLGTSKFAWHKGKHSEDIITNARHRILDKVKRSPMMIGRGYEEYWMVVPWDNL